jgi:glucose 1-dehydrogenase
MGALRLAGKRALVTGAGRGIGRGVAQELARAGASVVINDLSPNGAAEAAASMLAQGLTAHALAFDAGDRDKIDEGVDRAIALLGGLDIVVCNAVYSDRQLFYRADMAGFHRTIQVSMWGPFYLTRAAALRMIDQKTGGNIVCISSPHAHLAMPGAMAYNMAKAATDQMARTAAVELAEYRIRVNIIHPGWIDTPGERKFFSEKTLQERGSELPWGRLGRPEEIGRGVVYLCDPESEYITGSTLTIDGGIQLPWRDMFRVREQPATPS